MLGRWQHTRTLRDFPTHPSAANALTGIVTAGDPHNGWTFLGDRWKHEGGSVEIGNEMASHGGWDWLPESVAVTAFVPVVPPSSVVPANPPPPQRIAPDALDPSVRTGIAVETVKSPGAAFDAAEPVVSVASLTSPAGRPKLVGLLIMAGILWFVLRK